ncbi:MAG: ankyrin-3-like, partial [Chlamydiales bacterium]|nr:ankyrin-3-like [Chlamydiales bacterium]
QLAQLENTVQSLYQNKDDEKAYDLLIKSAFKYVNFNVFDFVLNHSWQRLETAIFHKDLFELFPKVNLGGLLNLALKYQRISATSALISQDCSILHFKDIDGDTPLHMAVRVGHLPIVELLLENGARVDSQTKDGSTPLHIACQKGFLEIAQKLLETDKETIAIQAEGGFTPLHMAAIYGQLPIVKLLLENGARVNSQIIGGWTPLHIACQKGLLEIAQKLIETDKETIAIQGGRGFTPLHLAASFGQLPMVELLLKNGAQIDSQAEDGSTPLHMACQKGFLEIAQKLIETDKETIAIQDRQGFTPLHMAASFGQLPIVKLLLGNGASLKSQDLQSFTALNEALNKNQIETAIYLMPLSRFQFEYQYDNSPLWLLLQKQYSRETFKHLLMPILGEERINFKNSQGKHWILEVYQDEEVSPLKEALEEVIQEKGLILSHLLNQKDFIKLLSHLKAPLSLPLAFESFFVEKKGRDQILDACLTKSFAAYQLCQNFPKAVSDYLADRRLEGKVPLTIQRNVLPLLGPTQIKEAMSLISSGIIHKLLEKNRYYLIEEEEDSPISAATYLERLQQKLKFSLPLSFEDEIQALAPTNEDMLVDYQHLLGKVPPILLAAAFMNDFKPALKQVPLAYFKWLNPLQQQALIPLFNQETFHALLMKYPNDNLIKQSSLEQKQAFLEINGLNAILDPIHRIMGKGELERWIQEELSQLEIQDAIQKGQKIVNILSHPLTMAKQMLEQQIKQILDLGSREVSQELEVLAAQKNEAVASELEAFEALLKDLKERLAKLQRQMPEVKVPEAYRCPISQEIMVEPYQYTLSNGHSYTLDQATIDQLREGKASFTCPFSRETITSFRPRLDLKEQIAQFLGH